MVKGRLNPGGVVTQWVPLYESDMDTVKSEIATFFDVFPNGAIFANEVNGGGYDVVLLGMAEPQKIDVDAMEARLTAPAYQAVAQSLREVGFNSVTQLVGTYAGEASELKPWLADAAINRDGNLRLQYLAGMALNNNKEGEIYGAILQYRQYPEALFKVSDALKPGLMSAIQTRGN